MHQLETPWTFWIDRRDQFNSKEPGAKDGYLSSLKEIGTFSTIEEFWAYVFSFSSWNLWFHYCPLNLFHSIIGTNLILLQLINSPLKQKFTALEKVLNLPGKHFPKVPVGIFVSENEHSVSHFGKIYFCPLLVKTSKNQKSLVSALVFALRKIAFLFGSALQLQQSKIALSLLLCYSFYYSTSYTFQDFLPPHS